MSDAAQQAGHRRWALVEPAPETCPDCGRPAWYSAAEGDCCNGDAECLRIALARTRAAVANLTGKLARATERIAMLTPNPPPALVRWHPACPPAGDGPRPCPDPECERGWKGSPIYRVPIRTRWTIGAPFNPGAMPPEVRTRDYERGRMEHAGRKGAKVRFWWAWRPLAAPERE